MRFPRFLSARVRGFRIVNLLGATIFLVIAVGSYALKTFAGAQDAGAAGVEDQIVQEQKRIKMLKIEIAHLSTPQRIGDLSRRYLNAGPVDAKHDIAVAALPAIAAAPPPPVATPAAATPAPATPR